MNRAASALLGTLGSDQTRLRARLHFATPRGGEPLRLCTKAAQLRACSRPEMAEAGSAGDPGDDQTYTVLRHPSGALVYVIGTAHVSRAAVQEVTALIQRVQPAVVVLELDAEREGKLLKQAEEGDTYGLRKIKSKGTLQVLRMAFTGEALNWFLASIYTVSGAVMGTTPGGEFLAAIEAAREQGAQVVLGDRAQDVTMQRLLHYTRYLTRQDSRRQAEERRMRSMMDSQSGQRPFAGAHPTDATGQPPDFLRRGQPPPTYREREVEAEVASEAVVPEDPWGLGPDDNTEAGMRRRLLEMMREGGCARPNEVLAAARRLFETGMDPRGSISPADILAVRSCGESLVDTFRRRAMQGDDTWMQRLEQEQVAGAKGAAGMDRSNAAMRKVIVDERDLILARRLWEAGQASGSQPVVGVVGAGHVKGISRYWEHAGDAETEEAVERYLRAPEEDRASPHLGAAMTAAVLGTIAYRRPRAAALFCGAVALMSAPYLGFMVVTVNRFSRFATKLVSTVETMDAEGGLGQPGFEPGWGGGGSDWSD